MLLECVVNVSEGRDSPVLRALDAAAGRVLLDRHSDADHHRSVLTLVGSPDEVEGAVRDLANVAVSRLDLRTHQGVHPRLGVLDVVPFVGFDEPEGSEGPLRPVAADRPDLTGARDRFGAWAGHELGLPGFAYGPASGRGDGRGDYVTRTLPEVRREAFGVLPPDWGPPEPHPSAGAVAVGSRGVLVAYNLWLGGDRPGVARRLAAAIRGPGVRALGLVVGARLQVSCNLVDPLTAGPAAVYDRVAELARTLGDEVVGAELVGLLPAAVLERVPEDRWVELDLDAGATLEARLKDRSLRRR